jgi:hypothetical protein
MIAYALRVAKPTDLSRKKANLPIMDFGALWARVRYELWHVHLDRLFTIALLLSSIIILGQYAFPSETQIAPPLHGFRIETNSTMIHLLSFGIELDANSRVLSLNGQWKYINQTRDIGRDFNIVVALPFTIQAFYWVPYYSPKIENWSYVNTNVTDVVADAVIVSFSGNSTKSLDGYFYGKFIVAKTYASSHRGSYTIVIPLDAGIGAPYFPDLDSLESRSGVSCCALPDEIHVTLTFPRSAVNIQLFPPGRVGFFRRWPDNMTMYYAEWEMTQRTQVTLSYVDEAEQSTREGRVIMSSLLLGAGISGIGDWLKGVSTPKRAYLWYRRITRNILKSVGRWRRRKRQVFPVRGRRNLSRRR